MSDRPSPPESVPSSRREFLKTTGAAAAAVSLAASFVHASDKSGSKLAVIGSGEHTYECHHGWGQLPAGISWGETHGVAIDAAGNIYIKHAAYTPEPMDAIVVFDPQGQAIRSFGKEYHGGGHGIDIRRENGEEFLYLCDIKNRHVTKTNLMGEVVWRMTYPAESNLYQKLEQFRPTNVAFAPDGGFYVGDGYGSHFIHHYDANAKWLHSWGGEGTEPGKMRTPHGIWLDNRPGREPSLVVADRANARLQYFTLDGQHLSFVDDVSFPAHFDIRGDELLVPDLHARVTIMNAANEPIVHLGYDPEWTKTVLEGFVMRRTPDKWEAGRFIHPHDACFDAAGNIFVVEWVATGRVTWLRRVG